LPEGEVNTHVGDLRLGYSGKDCFHGAPLYVFKSVEPGTCGCGILLSGLIEGPGRVYGFFGSFFTHEGGMTALDIRLNRSISVVGREAFVALVVSQFATERGGMIERGRKMPNGPVWGGPLQDAPVVIVPIGVANPGVNEQKSEKCLRGRRNLVWKRPVRNETNIEVVVSEYFERQVQRVPRVYVVFVVLCLGIPVDMPGEDFIPQHEAFTVSLNPTRDNTVPLRPLSVFFFRPSGQLVRGVRQINQRTFKSGDPFRLDVRVSAHGETREMSLAVTVSLWNDPRERRCFFPSWTEAVEWIDLYHPRQGTYPVYIADFRIPEPLHSPVTLVFNAYLFNQTTQRLYDSPPSLPVRLTP